MSLFEELKRRNVFRVAVAYIVASWVIIQAASLLLEIFDAPASIMRVMVALLALGFVLSIIFAWAFELTPEGIRRDSEIDRTRTGTQQSAKRLDMLTIGLVVVAFGMFAVDRFMRDEPAIVPADLAGSNEPDQGATRIAQQLVKIDRLRDKGEYGAAFALASEIESVLPDASVRDELWAGISWATDIETEPTGARVLRQPMDASKDDWEDLGTTPLTNVRFALDEGYRLRFELAGHRPVELLQTVIRPFPWRRPEPVKLDPIDVLPEEMVRIRGFARDLVDYADFFMDRYEVTNREFARFVEAGGYETPEYWQQPFLKDGVEIPWQQAMEKFVDRTGRSGPASWTGGAYPEGRGDYPVNGVSWYEAAAYAQFVSKQLPTIAHFDAARRFDNIDSGLIIPRSNIGGEGPRPVGYNRAMNTLGIYDLVGNVREWCWNQADQGTRGTTGAGWTDGPFHQGWIIPKSSWDRDATNGIRLIRTFDSTEKLARLRQPESPPPRRDLWNEAKTSKEEFEIYRRMYAYDPLPLNAEIVAVDRFENWNRERIEFDVPYGERGGAFLYVPNHARPPYQAVVNWGGSHLMYIHSVENDWVDAFNFIIRSGRVVASPIFKGAYDRDDESFSLTSQSIWGDSDESGTTWRDFQIKWVQDLSRTIDYLETREDIDSSSLGYYGLSWGSGIAPIVLAVEDRIGPAVLNVGGLEDVGRSLPEADPLTFVRFVKNPVLMLNGEYDIVFPLETSQKPMFEMLGTDPADKKHYIAPSGHLVPREATVRETLDWFDRYLGRVDD
jgi:hypothetical protein